ncbi:MAG: O-acetyl-ADP-ribose deacetylase [Actinomycetota bacterium]|nr:O-acetyl-ADP-ribose deacetylase [Actinomycetota bacterium]
MPRIVIVEGDITEQDADAIVNAANTALRPGGGVDGAITRAAGPDALAEREQLIVQRGFPPLPTGEAVATGGGRLKARWIIHTAGPVYAGDERDAILLAKCHESCLRVADEIGATIVAFPAISTGVYGYPADEAAPVALSTVMNADTRVDEVRFVLFGTAMLETFEGAMRALAEAGPSAPR